MNAYSAAEIRTFHCESVRKMLSGLDQSMLLEFLCTDREDFRRRVAEVSLRAYASSFVCLKELLIQRVLMCLLCSSDETISRYSRSKTRRLCDYLILTNSWVFESIFGLGDMDMDDDKEEAQDDEADEPFFDTRDGTR